MMARMRFWHLLAWILVRDQWCKRKTAGIEVIGQGVIDLETVTEDGIGSIAIVVGNIDTTETRTGKTVIVTTVNIANTDGIGLGHARYRGPRDRNVAIEDQRQTTVVTLVVPGVIGQVLRDVIVVIMKVAEMHNVGIIVVEQSYLSAAPILFVLELCMAMAFLNLCC
jgi:hypothetical protein